MRVVRRAPFLRRVVSLAEVSYRETEHYRVTRDFLNAPERFFKHLFRPDGSESDAE
jgi:hypothetical protein